MDDHVARRKRIFGLGMLVVGAVVYLVGLWPGCHTLSEKGYFFAAIVMCGFPVLIRQEHTGNGRLLSRCKSLLLLGIGMVAVGVFGAGGRAENTVSGGAGGQYIWNRSLRFLQ